MNKKIKVLRIIARLNVGGPAVQITGIAEGLNPAKFDHLILTGSCQDSEVDYLQQSGKQVISQLWKFP